jgi:3-hydroxymyristoyl/3-hydroxydecanoyl-(acyl carrier protein) dehydratase/acyl carrier protein
MNSGIEIETVAVAPLSEDERAELADSLKRCTEETRKAAFQFRETGKLNLLPTIILGIVERFLEPEIRPKLKEGDGSLKLIDDLGIDSLTMMEIVVLVEESLDLSIDNEELRDLRTLDDIRIFLDAKIRNIPLPEKNKHFGVEAILATIPHHVPFLFLNEVSLGKEEAIGSYTISGLEDFLKGHFPDNPVFPASIMLEALGQLAVFYLVKTQTSVSGHSVDPKKIFFTGCEAVRCQRVCVPGETLTMTIKPRGFRPPIAKFEGKITVKGETAAWAEDISLTFDWTTASDSAV